MPSTPPAKAKKEKATEGAPPVEAVEPTVEPVAPEPPEPQEELAVPVSSFVRDASHAVAVAGLIASDPELQEAEFAPSEWERRLTEYLASPRP